MIRLALAATLAASLGLAGCADTGSLPSAGGSTPATPGGKIEAIRAYARAVCRFEPKAAFVGRILAIAEPELAPGVDLVSYLGGAICTSVRTAYASLRAGGPFGHGEVLGVPVRGDFLR